MDPRKVVRGKLRRSASRAGGRAPCWRACAARSAPRTESRSRRAAARSRTRRCARAQAGPRTRRCAPPAHRRYSSMRPSSARISSVGGCVVEARGLSSMRSSASSSVTVWPRRAAASAATPPTGPAPTTRMFRRCMDRGDYTEPVMEPCRLGARQAAARIERGELSARSLLESCLERIAAREPEVQAWSFVDQEAVLPSQPHSTTAKPARASRRREGHLRHLRHADAVRLAHLSRPSAARRLGAGRAHPRRRRIDPRQDRDLRVRDFVPGKTRNPHNPATRPEAPPAARPRRWPTSWCRSRSAPRLPAR